MTLNSLPAVNLHGGALLRPFSVTSKVSLRISKIPSCCNTVRILASWSDIFEGAHQELPATKIAEINLIEWRQSEVCNVASETTVKFVTFSAFTARSAYRSCHGNTAGTNMSSTFDGVRSVTEEARCKLQVPPTDSVTPHNIQCISVNERK